MVRPFALACGVLCGIAMGAPAPRDAAPAIGNLRLPVTVADLAAAVGLRRADPATIPTDIVRLAFASPDGSNVMETRARAALAAALSTSGNGDLVPLPLSADLWRTRILRTNVPDDRLAAAIFERRDAALLYHALLGIDGATLAWIEQHPAVAETLLKYAAPAAVYARSLRIVDGAVQTPGEAARDVWRVLVGADPADPAAFIAKLFSARGARVAAFYDAVAHADAAHQAFAIGRADGRARVDRAWRVLDAVARASAPWHVDDRPFLRPDVDLSVILRVVAVDAHGTPRPPASKELWARVFRERDAGDGDVDAEWLARALFDESGALARRRLNTFAFAQRVFGGAAVSEDLAFVLQQHPRFVALLSLLADNGMTDPAAYARAIRAASAIEGDDDALVVFQAGLAIVDRARAAGTIAPGAAGDAVSSLAGAAVAKDARAALLAWLSTDLPRVLAPAAQPDIESAVLAALAGPAPSRRDVITWEGQDYVADLSRAELRRLTRVRKAQDEPPLDAAIAASRGRNLAALAQSLAGIVYAAALGEPDGRPLTGGAVWRRHRFGGDGPGQEPKAFAWRLATEVFGASGWHLNGSLLYLHVALGHLSLRRLDESEMPVSSLLSTNDRRTIAMSVALADPRRLTDADRDAIAAALARGRARVLALAAQPQALDDLAAAAAIGEWRRNAVSWTLATNPRAVRDAFTVLEMYRAGGGQPLDDWGAAANALDGCMCLRMPRGSWEESDGRPSTGQLGTHFADVMLRAADVLAARKLPALLARDIAAFATCDTLDRGGPSWSGDWLTIAFAARDIPGDRFDDYIGALTAGGPLATVAKGSR